MDFHSIDLTRFLEVPVWNYDLTTMGKLLEEFYRHNILPIDYNLLVAFQLDPEGLVPSGSPTYLNTYYAVMYRRFFATITLNPRDVHTYHRMQLWYRCEQVRASIWVASAQSNECYFFDAPSIQASVYRATRCREWYQSPDENKKTVIS